MWLVNPEAMVAWDALVQNVAVVPSVRFRILTGNIYAINIKTCNTPPDLPAYHSKPGCECMFWSYGWSKWVRMNNAWHRVL